MKHFKEIIVGMDHNLDLLKTNSHSEIQHFININFNNNFFPCITRPTRITKSTATLINNIFISQKLHKTFDSCVIINEISDHMHSMINIHEQGYSNNEALEFKCRSLDKNKIKEINNKLLTTDWSTLNNTVCKHCLSVNFKKE